MRPATTPASTSNSSAIIAAVSPQLKKTQNASTVVRKNDGPTNLDLLCAELTGGIYTGPSISPSVDNLKRPSHSSSILSNLSAAPMSRFPQQSQNSVLGNTKDSSDHASCESIVSGKGRVSVLKKSSLNSLNSVVSTNSCLRSTVSESRTSSRREKHGVSFAVPYASNSPDEPQVRQRLSSDTTNRYFEKKYPVHKHQDREPLMFNSSSFGTSTAYLTTRSSENFNMDEFGIIVGASSNDSIVSGTYSYDAVMSASTDSEMSNTRRLSPNLKRSKKNLEVDPWRVDNISQIAEMKERERILVRRDTPPPKPMIPSSSDKDLREFIKRRNTPTLSMSSQALRRSRGGDSSENLVSRSLDSNDASIGSIGDEPIDPPGMFSRDDSVEERNYENIETISAAIRKSHDNLALDNIVKKVKSPDESTYL